MKNKISIKLFIIVLSLLLFDISIGKELKKIQTNVNPEVYIFTNDIKLKHTPIKDQYKSNTCWAFATISFLESELLRMDKGEFDLSEMYVVRNVYPQKALLYIRNHGNANFGEGGQSHDVIKTIKRYGIVSETIYPGLQKGENRHDHSELYAVLKSMLDAVLSNKNNKITPLWQVAFESIIDIYLGKPPQKFDFNRKSYTPQSFVNDVLQLNLDDYIEITSYGFYSFYKKINLQIPDNWDHDSNYINVPIDDMEAIVDYAIKNGYTVIWDGDVSEKEFSTKTLGYAVVPIKSWEEKKLAEQQTAITTPEEEKQIAQQLRDDTFNNFTTTDDHLMHIIGLAHDQKGTKFYLIKNSSGPDRKYEGYVYLSRSYFRLKTIAITVNKKAIPEEIYAKIHSFNPNPN